MKLVFATHNQNKVMEIKELLPESIELIGLNDLGLREEIPETGKTLEENSLIKARVVYEKFSLPAFADDTGLEVRSLNNSPGVRSARYAGEQKSSSDNIDLLISELSDKTNRDAQFRTVITLYLQLNVFHQFEGKVTGRIIYERRGAQGFGYDPVFIPDGYDKTFAEMPLSEKNRISHRAKALRKFIDFLGR
ncbi:MAG TPA: RdgB/HAM1 family non-canonical purine NTP pyrophosphatase [Cyclobacteriaceae bacterium]